MQFRLLLVRLLIFFAMAICASQFADHVTSAGAFCSFGDTCEEVTASSYGNPLGVPLSLLGLVAFTVLFAFTLVPRRWGVLVVRVLGVLAGVIGISLLMIQFNVLHKVCRLCLIVDSTAIILGAIVAFGLPQPVALSRFRLLAWIMLAPLPILIPFAWTAATIPSTAPEQVQEHWKKGEITIVELTDFECSYCQKADAVLREVLSHHKVNLVRLPAPMTKHQHSNDAARAYIAARKLGKGEEMAAALYQAESRAPDKCREIAARIGLNLEDYDRVLTDSNTDTEWRRTLSWSKDDKRGLPLIWVQHQLLQGIPTPEALEDAIARARPAVK